MIPENTGNTAEGGWQSATCSALRGWGPMTLATVQAADMTEGMVTIRIHGPFPTTILGGQWFLFPDAPPAALRPDLDFMVSHTCSRHPEGMADKHGDCVPCKLGWPTSPPNNGLQES